MARFRRRFKGQWSVICRIPPQALRFLIERGILLEESEEPASTPRKPPASVGSDEDLPPEITQESLAREIEQTAARIPEQQASLAATHARSGLMAAADSLGRGQYLRAIAYLDLATSVLLDEVSAPPAKAPSSAGTLPSPTRNGQLSIIHRKQG